MIEVADRAQFWRVIKYGSAKAEYGLAPVKIEGQLVQYDWNYIEEWRRKYKTFQDLPSRTKEAVALLTLCDDNQAVKAVGRRVSRDTFWLDDNPALLAEYKKEK